MNYLYLTLFIYVAGTFILSVWCGYDSQGADSVSLILFWPLVLPFVWIGSFFIYLYSFGVFLRKKI